MSDLCLVEQQNLRSCVQYLYQPCEWCLVWCSRVGRKQQLRYPQLPLPYGPPPAPGPPTLLTCWPRAALITPHRPSLCFLWSSWPKSHQILFLCHSAESSILSIKECFARQQSMKTFYKAPVFFLRKPSLSQAWVTCRAVHSARPPLPSSHHLVWKEVTVCAFQPRGRCGTGGLHAVSRTCLLIPIGSMNNNTLVSGSWQVFTALLGLCDSFLERGIFGPRNFFSRLVTPCPSWKA